MYKNQQTYFPSAGINLNTIPEKVIDKSIIKIKSDRKPQKIKKIKKDVIKKKTKGIKELEREKLMKLYGKNNNMISLLIFLLKRKDDKKDKDKKQYKSKRAYGRGGYKKGNQYQTKTQLDKERKTDVKKAEEIQKNNKTFKETSKLLQKAQDPLTTQTEREQLIKQAEKLAKERLTDLDFEKYGGYVSGPEEQKSARAILDIKEAVEKEKLASNEERIKLLKAKQNQGRLDKKAEKDQSYIDYIAQYRFVDKLSQKDKIKIFEDYKTQNPQIDKPSKVGFLNLFQEKYKEFEEQVDLKGQAQVLKEGKEKDRLEKLEYFIKAIGDVDGFGSKVPSNKQVKKAIDEFVAQFPDIKKLPTKKEVKDIQAQHLAEQVPIIGAPSSVSGDSNISTNFKKVDDILEGDVNNYDDTKKNIDKVQEYLSKLEQKEFKQEDDEKRKTIEKEITGGYESLSTYKKRADILEAIESKYPVDEIGMPNFKDFTIGDDEYEANIFTKLTRLKGYDFPELSQYVDDFSSETSDISSDSSGRPLSGSTARAAQEARARARATDNPPSVQSVLENPDQIRREREGRFGSESDSKSDEKSKSVSVRSNYSTRESGSIDSRTGSLVRDPQTGNK